MKVSPRVRHGVEEEWLGGESRGESVYGWDEVDGGCCLLDVASKHISHENRFTYYIECFHHRYFLRTSAF